MSLLTVVCCQVEVPALGLSLVQGSPSKCGVSDCDYEASTMGKTLPTWGSCAMKKKDM